jgi:hypothetical protein
MPTTRPSSPGAPSCRLRKPIRIIYPFWPDTGKQLAETPQMHYVDTVLICHLTRWKAPDQLRLGAVPGHVFETFEIFKSCMNAGANLRDIWFCRDSKNMKSILPYRKAASSVRQRPRWLPPSNLLPQRASRAPIRWMDTGPDLATPSAGPKSPIWHHETSRPSQYGQSDAELRASA